VRVLNQNTTICRVRISLANIQRLMLVGLLALVFSGLAATGAYAQASNVYITQDGGGNGVCSSNVHNPAWFNNSANWGTSASQIGPGTIVHLCGVFQGAQNSNMFTVQGSGTNGNPITILFENGAKLTSPAWSGQYGAINITNSAYIVVDGGQTCGWINSASVPCNGIIENTNAGTNLGIHPNGFSSRAILGGNNLGHPGCTPGCRVTNLTIANLYVHVYTGSGAPDASPDQQNINGVIYQAAPGFRVDHCIIHDVGWAMGGEGNNIEIDHNDIYNVDHGTAQGSQYANYTGEAIHDNHIHDFANWDTGYGCTGCNSYHHDGIHFWTNGSLINSNIMIYNNLFDGQNGVNKNSFIYMEGTNNNVTVFNNVFVDAAGPAPAIANIWLGVNSNGVPNTGTAIYNNTCVGVRPENTCITLPSNPGVIYENNLMVESNTFFSLTGSSSIAVGDYNVYEAQGAGGNYAFNLSSEQTNSLNTWKSVSGQDAHSIYSPTISVNVDGTLQSGSPAIGAGKNLSNLGIAALNMDASGNPRPSSGAWDVGARNSGTSTALKISPPTGLKVSVQ
jgi:hypothetical protein